METHKKIEARFPPKLRFLFKPSRYKVLYGGRGGAKSWGVARSLLLLGMKDRLLILCTREFQNSVGDSVHKILSEQIVALGLESFYQVQATTIIGSNGSEFIFRGLRHNIASIKSLEGCDICWCEEAQTISKTSWEVLIPTIRKDGSEIWVTYNPSLETDETHQRFVLHPPTSAVVRKIGWQDNPWFPEVLRQEMEDLRVKDRDAYLNVWEGHCRTTLDGAVYARELRDATEQNHITTVPYDRAVPVSTFWDLGFSDSTAIFFAQMCGFEIHVIDYLEVSQRTVPEVLAILQARGYVYDTDWLPHDARAKTLASGGKSIEEMMRNAGRKVRITPGLSIADGINAARVIFPNTFFDQNKCSDALQALRHYRYSVDPETGSFGRQPIHDQYSHCADAFRYLAVSLKAKKETTVKLVGPSSMMASGGYYKGRTGSNIGGTWMGA